MMIEYRWPGSTPGEMLQEAAARMGWSTAEMTELLDSELDIDHLLEYVTAVLSRRMN